MRINRATLERIVNEELVRFLESRLREAPELGSPLDDAPPVEDEMDGPPGGDLPMAVGDEDSADADLDAELAGEEPEADPGSVAAEMQGKTIEAIEELPESDSVPGARELVMSFQGEEDKLRVIITPSGEVKYFWKGLHDSVGSSEEIPPEELEDDKPVDGEDLDVDSPALPTDDGGMDDPLVPEV
jgi:hypothetical protein